jgi:transmembrane 9 superfamily protein 3
MLYSVHYFVMKTKMTGFFQTAFYFGYTLMFCIGGLGFGGGLRHGPQGSCAKAISAAGRLVFCSADRPASVAAGLSMMCGAVGYLGSLAFVRRIFAQVKVD